MSKSRKRVMKQKKFDKKATNIFKKQFDLSLSKIKQKKARSKAFDYGTEFISKDSKNKVGYELYNKSYFRFDRKKGIKKKISKSEAYFYLGKNKKKPKKFQLIYKPLFYSPNID